MTNLSVESSRRCSYRVQTHGVRLGPQRRPLQISPRGPSLCQKQRPEEVTQAIGGGIPEAAALEIGGHTRNNHASSLDHPRSSHARGILFLFNRKNIVVGDQCPQSDSSYSLNKIISYLFSYIWTCRSREVTTWIWCTSHVQQVVNSCCVWLA